MPMRQRAPVQGMLLQLGPVSTYRPGVQPSTFRASRPAQRRRIARPDSLGSSLDRAFAWTTSRLAGSTSTVATRSRPSSPSIPTDQMVESPSGTGRGVFGDAMVHRPALGGELVAVEQLADRPGPALFVRLEELADGRAVPADQRPLQLVLPTASCSSARRLPLLDPADERRGRPALQRQVRLRGIQVNLRVLADDDPPRLEPPVMQVLDDAADEGRVTFGWLIRNWISEAQKSSR